MTTPVAASPSAAESEQAPPELGRGEATRRHIKQVARRLFATRSLEAVSIREIVKAAGQKNAGSIHYYFRSKDDLIRELILDVARLRDAQHEERLNALEAGGEPLSIRAVVAILAEPPQIATDDAGADDHALRFLNMVMINHRDLLFAAVQGGADRGIRRCFDHLKRLLPELPAPLVQQRLMLAMLYLFAVASSREAAHEQPDQWRYLWGHPAARDNLLDSIEGLLRQPPSPETLATLGTSPGGAPAPPKARRSRSG
ncbi:MAG: TetR/AcrR family transcriptional regulator [Rhizobiales bacterium]|nr:TetR/AcrR family transcriptional regulator [Hyphomicrobiales bacterium]